MERVLDILEELRINPSSKRKEQILIKNRDNELLQKVLYYTYSPYMKYKMTAKTINPIENDEPTQCTIFALLDILSSSNINDTLRDNVNKFLGSIKDEDERNTYIQMILKDLKIKCNAKTINKVFPNLIPSFSIMLAEKYWDYMDYLIGKMFTITMKMDGHRCIVIKENGNIRLMSRQGKPYEGLVELEEMFKEMSQDNFVIDGELLVANYKEIDPKDRYKATSKILRKKGEKVGITLVAFDYISLQEFKTNNCTTDYLIRRGILDTLVSFTESYLLEAVQILYHGNDVNVILPLLNEVTERGEEGLMINLDEAPYRLKRTKDILKVKKMLTADVRVVNVYKGEEGKEFENTMGGVTFEFIHEGEIYTCDCGSGFKVAEREEYWKDPSKIIGKIIEVHYFEVTTNENGGYGLRFPIFKGIREDKFEISMS